MKELTLEYMNKLEEEFSLNNYNGIKTEKESFKILEGNKNILISCAHSVDQERKGIMKAREIYTGAICKLIYEYTNCYVIYKYHNNGIDDNFILHTKYKEKIGVLIKEKDIKFVIDIHGMVGSKSKRFRGYNLELGTDNGRNLLRNKDVSEEMIRLFNLNSVNKVVLDKEFRASKDYTIAKYVSKNYKVPSIQVEIAGDFRNALDYDIENVKKLLKSFEDIIEYISNEL